MATLAVRKVIAAFLLLGTVAAHASDKNPLRSNQNRFEDCAEIESATGATCSDLTVRLNVAQCGDPKKVIRARVRCDESEAVATYRSVKFDYRAVFVPKKNWLGRQAWELKGNIERTRRKTEAEKMAEGEVDATAEEVAQANQAEDKVDRMLGFLSNLTAKGSVDFYYMVNLGRPAPIKALPTAAANQSQNTYRVFDNYHDSLQLSYARLFVQKPTEPVGVTFDLAYGPAMQTVAGTMTDTSQINLKQATLSYKAPNGLLIEAGRFVTHVGYEVIEAHENWNYSRSLLFGYFDPFWHQGIKATYPFSEKFSLTGLLVNGWNNSYDFNNNKNVGLQASYLINEHTSVVANYLTGQEPAAPAQPDGERKSIYDLIVTHKVSDVLSFALNADHMTYNAPTGAKAATGAAIYARYQLFDNWAINPRFEYIEDQDNMAFGATFAGGQKISSYTLTLENKLGEGLMWRAEGRLDKSSKEAFMRDGSPSASQETVTVALIGWF